MASTKYTFVRSGGEMEVCVDYEVAPYFPGNTLGPPEFCDPPEGGEVLEMQAYYQGTQINLTQKEEEEIEGYIYETHDYGE